MFPPVGAALEGHAGEARDYVPFPFFTFFLPFFSQIILLLSSEGPSFFFKVTIPPPPFLVIPCEKYGSFFFLTGIFRLETYFPSFFQLAPFRVSRGFHEEPLPFDSAPCKTPLATGLPA